MNILIVNDDGINKEGINLLIEEMKQFGSVYVVAPINEQSAKSHGINITGKFEYQKVDDNQYGLDGSPADCVKFALDGIFKNVKFDLIVSGINDGPNLGEDIYYSGTVSAALEGLMHNIPSIALSCGDKQDYSLVGKEITGILNRIINDELYSNEYVLVINFPKAEVKQSKGIKICKIGKWKFNNAFTITDDLILNQYETFGCIDDIESDVHNYLEGYITIVPVKLDRTDYDTINKLKTTF